MWQHLPEKLKPIVFNIGPIEISWYGIMYAVAFAVAYFLAKYRIQKKETAVSLDTVKDFMPWGILGLLIGARLGDIFIYDWAYFKNHLTEIFLPFDIYNHWRYIGIYGMSYFGGLIGLVIAFYIFCRVRKINLLEFSDLFAPAIPLAFTFGRLGNFINGELYGRATKKFWGMYFPADLSGQLRHPSQLYEAFLEGILLFVILWSVRNKNLFVGYLTAFYLIGSGLARFTAEFFREPDNGWFISLLTLGQWLAIAITTAGLFIIFRQSKKLRTASK